MSGQALGNGFDHQDPRDQLNSDCAHVHDNAEAYALGALDRLDRGRIENHLRWCGPCRRLIDELMQVTGLLPLLVRPAEPPSPRVKAALLERISRTGSGHPAGAPQPTPAPVLSDPPVRSDAPRPEPRPWPRVVAPLVVVPLTLALLVISSWAFSMNDEMSEMEQTLAAQQALERVLASTDDMRLYAMEPMCVGCTEAGASLGVSSDEGIGLLLAWNLNPNEEHEVWCRNDQGEKWKVTTLDVDSSGEVMQPLSFPGPVSDYDHIFISKQRGASTPEMELIAALRHEDDEQPVAATGTPAAG